MHHGVNVYKGTYDVIRFILDPLPATTTVEEATERVAELCIAYGDALRRLIDNLPDTIALELAAVLSADKPNRKGFRVVAYDEAAETIRGEIGFRYVAKAAEASGEPVYCLTCEGACGPQHEENAHRKFPPMSANELRIRALSRDDLIKELLAAGR